MFEDAIRYPWKGEKHVETIAIGGILSLLGFLLIPMFLVYGFAVRVVRDVAAGETETPPVFEDWGALFVDGLKAFVVVFLYSLVPAAVFAVAAFSWLVPVVVATGGEGSGAVGAIGVLFGIAVLLVAVVLSIAALYLVPAAVAAFARTGRLGAAFSPTELRSIGAHGGYATGWLVAVGVTLLANVVGGVVSATGVGVLFLPFLSFYGLVAASYAVGAGVSDLPLVEREDGTPTVGRPAA